MHRSVGPERTTSNRLLAPYSHEPGIDKRMTVMHDGRATQAEFGGQISRGPSARLEQKHKPLTWTAASDRTTSAAGDPATVTKPPREHADRSSQGAARAVAEDGKPCVDNFLGKNCAPGDSSRDVSAGRWRRTSCVHQSTLDGITPATPAPRKRGGRPPLPDHKKPVGRYDVGVYREDEEALRVLREAGYGHSASEILRRAARERAAELAARGPQNGGRLAV